MATSQLQSAQSRLAYLLVLPATLLILVIYIIPIILVFLASLTDYTLVSDYYEFVGLENYRKMFGDEVFANAVSNTFFYAALFLPGAFIISLILAIAIQEQKQFRSVLEVLYFLPVTSTLAAMALVWAALMDSGQGVINNSLETFGIPGVNWFGSEEVVLYSLAIISLWSVIGFNMVLFLAGLTSIPQNLYEAAAMDGADHPFDKFFRRHLAHVGTHGDVCCRDFLHYRLQAVRHGGDPDPRRPGPGLRGLSLPRLPRRV